MRMLIFLPNPFTENLSNCLLEEDCLLQIECKIFTKSLVNIALSCTVLTWFFPGKFPYSLSEIDLIYGTPKSTFILLDQQFSNF